MLHISKISGLKIKIITKKQLSSITNAYTTTCFVYSLFGHYFVVKVKECVVVLKMINLVDIWFSYNYNQAWTREPVEFK